MKELEYSQRRQARNELSFRDINNDINKVGDSVLTDGEKILSKIEFVCECSKVTCFDKIGISLREYEEIRNKKMLFIVAPGHETPDIEEIVRREHNFLVVRKTGKASDEVKKLTV